MNRFLLLMVNGLLTSALVGLPARADDPTRKLTAEERKELDSKVKELTEAGIKAYEAGKYSDAIMSWEESLKIVRRLYNTAEFPDGHSNLSNSLNNLALLYWRQHKLTAVEPLWKEALEVHRRLFKGQDHLEVAKSLNNLAVLYEGQGKLSEAEPLLKEALGMYQRLFKGQDHNDIANGLNNLGTLYQSQGRLGEAEPLQKEGLEMYQRLFKGQDHKHIADSLNRLASLYRDQGKLDIAEQLCTSAVEMSKRLFKGQDHQDIVTCLTNLAILHQAQGKLVVAEPLFKDALEMTSRLCKGQDHPELAMIFNNLARLYKAQGRLNIAEPLFKKSLEMNRRLFKNQDHRDLAASLNNLARLYQAQGKLVEAEPLYRDSLEMYRRLFRGKDQLDLARCLNNFAFHQAQVQGQQGNAELLFKEALEMYRRQAVAFSQVKIEGETLTLLTQQPLTRDGYLSTVQGADPAGAYAQVWADKGSIARAYERRQLQARAAAPDPKAAQVLGDLSDARRRRAELLLAPATTDPGTLAQRRLDITTYEERIEKNARDLKVLLPASVRAERLDAALPGDLQKALPVDAAVVDFLRFVHFEYDPGRPGTAGETRTPRYLAFVVTKEKVAWLDLDTAEKIEPAVNAWRESISRGKEIPAAIPARVRELVWDKIRQELPSGIRTVYVCPDAALCRVPFAALPGDKPGSILLEDFAVAMIPHAPFLLDKLWPQDPITNPPTNALVVGGVKYDAELASPTPAPNAIASRGDPLVKPGQKLGWVFLSNTTAEANGIVAAAERKKLAAARLEGDQATSAAVLAALPKAKYAHFATHGFFADPSFRSVFQLDDKDYENRGGERVGKAALSPLVMTGLVFAGANQEKTPGRGIVTGEQLIDLDLSGLELAVLSACETGLGDVAGGQGTFGLQRAFHYAGTTNVVCSLWKVPDASTAALMNLFYTNLWDKNLSPLESLRQAQLAVYRNPGRIAEWAKGFRGQFELVKGAGGAAETRPTPSRDGKAHPLDWAAFTLSGPGR
jgi:CHAT domain-containing protein/tetratricopeptide (TPR) repeat protein